MPKTKARKDSSDSDSGPEDKTPAKKTKSTAPAKKSSGSGDGELSWDLGKNKFVKLSEFKGKWYVNIREYYLDTTGLKPGKKGIMLTLEQYQLLKDAISGIDEGIAANV